MGMKLKLSGLMAGILICILAIVAGVQATPRMVWYDSNTGIMTSYNTDGTTNVSFNGSSFTNVDAVTLITKDTTVNGAIVFDGDGVSQSGNTFTFNPPVTNTETTTMTALSKLPNVNTSGAATPLIIQSDGTLSVYIFPASGYDFLQKGDGTTTQSPKLNGLDLSYQFSSPPPTDYDYDSNILTMRTAWADTLLGSGTNGVDILVTSPRTTNYTYTIRDADTYQILFTIGRNGIGTISGTATTGTQVVNFDAMDGMGYLTNEVLWIAVSNNVPLLDADNTFTGHTNTFQGHTLNVDLSDTFLIRDADASNTVRFQVNSANGNTLIGGAVFAPSSYSTDLSAFTTRDLFIKDNGQLGYITSSRVYKTNIIDIAESDYAKLMSMRPRKYDRTSGEVVGELGLIAEEVDDLDLDIPNLVSYKRITHYETNKTGKVVVSYSEDKTTPQTINYSRLIPMLLDAAQRQQSEVNALKQRVTDLENPTGITR